MRRIVAGLFMSLDGVVERPDQWAFQYMDDEMTAEMGTSMASADAVLMGRCTYLEFAEMWPHQEGSYADFMNSTPKYVVSSTLERVDWAGSQLVTGAVSAELAKLKQQPGKDIMIGGSPTLVRSLLREGLLDELNVNVIPVVRGKGARLFDDTTAGLQLTAVKSVTYPSGATALTYHRSAAS